MKLKLTPTRISLLAFSAFAALVAQELMRSDSQAPSASASGGSKIKRKTSYTMQPLATVPAAQALSVPDFAFKPASSQKLETKESQSLKQSKAPKPEEVLLTAAAPSLSESISAPPPPPRPSFSVRTVSVGSLPIDQIVSASLSSGTQSKARPTAVDPKQAETSPEPKAELIASPPQVTQVAAQPLPVLDPPTAPEMVKSGDAEKVPLPKVSAESPVPTVTPVANQSISRALPPERVPQFSSPQPTQTGFSEANQDYTLGAGDRIKVEIFNVPEYSKEYQVLVNGTINLHRAGGINVTGLTLKQVERTIGAKYARLVKKPSIDVSLLSARAMNVSIAGEIGRPGSYTLALAEGGKFPTVTKLIREAGGMNRSANPKQVIVRRAQQEIRVNLWDLFQTGNSAQDVSLRDGDTIFIPPATDLNIAEANQLASANFAVDSTQPINIAVVGEVARPGPYALARGNAAAGLPTLTQALQQAGGITQMANIRDVEVRRSTRSGAVQSVKVDLWKLLREGDLKQDLVLQQGDTIAIATATTIDPKEAKDRGTASFAPGVMRVNVVGEVVRPGSLEVATNSPLNQALLAAGGFTKDAKSKSVQLVRLNPNGSVSRQEIPIDLARGIDEKGNPILQNNDVIIVDRNGGAKLRNSLGNILDPVGRILPFRFLFCL